MYVQVRCTYESCNISPTHVYIVNRSVQVIPVNHIQFSYNVHNFVHTKCTLTKHSLNSHYYSEYCILSQLTFCSLFSLLQSMIAPNICDYEKYRKYVKCNIFKTVLIISNSYFIFHFNQKNIHSLNKKVRPQTLVRLLSTYFS